MHLYFFLRGIYNRVEMFKTYAQCQYWQWKRINLKTKKEQVDLVQGALRPTIWGAYEYIFPEECLSEVLSVFGITEDLITAQTKLLRMFFPCKPIPKTNIEEAKKIASTIKITGYTRGLGDCKVAGVHVIPIGIKKDNRQKWKLSGFEQEML